MPPPTDRALLIAAAGGREQAFAELYHRYADALRAYFIRSLDGNASADDLVQQVFVQLLGSKAFQHPRTGPDKLDKLLFTIAKNLVRNQQRGEQRRSGREAEYHQRHTAEEEVPQRINTTALNAALNQLPDHQRQPLLLRFRHEMDIRGIADLMDCAPGTIKSRIHYGLKRLAHLLQALGTINDQPKP